MELGALVALGTAEVVLGLADAELAEVLGRLGHDVLEAISDDLVEHLVHTTKGHVEEDTVWNFCQFRFLELGIMAPF